MLCAASLFAEEKCLMSYVLKLHIAIWQGGFFETAGNDFRRSSHRCNFLRSFLKTILSRCKSLIWSVRKKRGAWTCCIQPRVSCGGGEKANDDCGARGFPVEKKISHTPYTKHNMTLAALRSSLSRLLFVGKLISVPPLWWLLEVSLWGTDTKRCLLLMFQIDTRILCQTVKWA